MTNRRTVSPKIAPTSVAGIKRAFPLWNIINPVNMQARSTRRWLAACAVIFVSGFAHAAFIKYWHAGLPWSSAVWHLLQWLPLLCGSIGFSLFGMAVCDRADHDVVTWYGCGREGRKHNFFGWLGRIAVPYLLAACGYVAGLEVW